MLSGCLQVPAFLLVLKEVVHPAEQHRTGTESRVALIFLWTGMTWLAVRVSLPLQANRLILEEETGSREELDEILDFREILVDGCSGDVVRLSNMS